MVYPTNGGLPFNQKPSTIIHLDLNSCFATIEQQANPLLRGKPIAVAAYASPAGCILAPSVEAKKLGVKVGHRVREGQLLCPELIILPPDPWKYRNVHLQIKKLLSQYTDSVIPKSIDEFVLNFDGRPALSKGMKVIAAEIKQRIKREIGDWLTVSVGIAPNIFLAKLACGLKKPDGLEEINFYNYLDVYSRLSLVDLPGIKKNLASRLANFDILTVLDFFTADLYRLRSAFESILGFYWYLRLRGWEIDDVVFSRRSFGNMYSLPKPLSRPSDLAPILHKLVQKMSHRMRRQGFRTRGVHLSLLYRDHDFWHRGLSLSAEIFDSLDIYRQAYRILLSSPQKKAVANLAVSVFNLTKNPSLQLDLFDRTLKKFNLTAAVDKINERWGDFVITPAFMLGTGNLVPDRISFGNVKELEQFIIR